MTGGGVDLIRRVARAFGALLIAFAGLFAWRIELGLAGAAAAGLAIGMVMSLHLLLEGWREARAAVPIGLRLTLIALGAGLLALGWLAPSLAPVLAPEAYALHAALIAIDLADPLLSAGAALAMAGSTLAVLAVFVARAADLNDEVW
jgi:hypothetical protein